jgi:Protein of unknown function (DUF3443)
MRYLRVLPAVATFLAFGCLAGCGGSSSNTTPPNTIAPSGSNVAAISVNGGPLGNYPDAAFTSVTVCVPGTSSCQTVDNVLVDTGSSGLRILSSALTLTLPQQITSSGNPTFECFLFVSGYTWGAVATADVEMASEKASSTPIQVIGESTPVPGACADQSPYDSDSLEALGANGILGVGLFAQDCGDPSCPANFNVYFDCPTATTCTAITATTAQEVPNPVTLFTTDNNGVIVELPAVSGGEEASLSGSLVFGIGTQSNNALGSAKIYSADDYGNFTATFNNTPYSSSFIDSGSNGYFFPDSSITQCSSNVAPGFYCPASTASLSATNQGANGTSGAVAFSIANAETLFTSSDNAFGDLGGTYSGAFDWGLPFFFGRNVFVGVQSTNYPAGYWAY